MDFINLKMSIFFRILLGIVITLGVNGCGYGDRIHHEEFHRKFNQMPKYSFVDVQKVLDEQITQWNNGSVDGFMKGYWQSDSMLFITSKGPRYGYQAVSDSYKKNYPSKEAMGTLRFEIVKMQWIEQQASVCEVLGKWHIDESSSPKSGYFSLIFKAIQGKPRIVIDHTW